MEPNYLFSEVREINDEFLTRKRDSGFLSNAYYSIGYDKKGERVAGCGTFLSFAHEIEDGVINPDGKLVLANFCKDRLCPMCMWRRSLKIFSQISEVMNVCGNNYRYLFLTLTIPNCCGSDLRKTIQNLYNATIRMFRKKRFNFIRGIIRTLECTYNLEHDNWHPHLHLILAVDGSYFGRDYMRQDEWQRYWYESYYKLPFNPTAVTKPLLIVDIRKVKSKDGIDFGSAVAEISKYSVKPDNFLYSDELLTQSIVQVLTEQMHGLRMFSLSGCFKDAFNELQLQDVESSDIDLIHINSNWNTNLEHILYNFHWKCGFYVMSEPDFLPVNSPRPGDNYKSKSKKGALKNGKT